jgi:tight adherence protein C
MSAARLKMLRAGYRSKNAVRMFHAMQFVLGIGFAGGGAWSIPSSSTAPSRSICRRWHVHASAGARPAITCPVYWVPAPPADPPAGITDGFPRCARHDAGLRRGRASRWTSRSSASPRKSSPRYPALAEEFEIVSQEVKAGKERVRCCATCPNASASGRHHLFVTTMIQSATFGTSIAEALRVYAAEMRDKRVMRAEEKANTLPTKLTLGTMLFTVPPLLIILIGPSVHGIMKAFGG